MLASYRHGFIFIKTMKTAGTSLEVALSRLCGPDDIISPAGPAEDIARAQEYGVLPINFTRDAALASAYLAALQRGSVKEMRTILAIPNMPPVYCNPHMTAPKIRAWVGEEFWRRAVKVAAERHPYEKVVSMAHFRFAGEHRHNKEITFEQILHSVIYEKPIQYRSDKFCSIDGVCAVDEFILQDNIATDFGRVAARLNLPNIDLPHRRGTTRKDRTPAKDILTDDQKRHIYKTCLPEFERFGWQR